MKSNRACEYIYTHNTVYNINLWEESYLAGKSVKLLVGNRNWRPYIPMNGLEFHPKAVGEHMPLHPLIASSPDSFPI